MTDRPPRADDPADEQGQPGATGAPVEDEDPDIAWGRAIEEARARVTGSCPRPEDPRRTGNGLLECAAVGRGRAGGPVGGGEGAAAAGGPVGAEPDRSAVRAGGA